MAERDDPPFLKIPIRVLFPEFDDTPPVWANHVAIQFLGNEFAVSFYAALPPLVSGTTPEDLARMRAVESVPARCVAKVIIGRDRLGDVAKALTETLERVQTLIPPEGPKGGDAR
jgi:hypothetical protein